MTSDRLCAANAGAGGAISAFLILLFLANVGRAQTQVVLDAKRDHHGIAGRPEWDEFAAE